MPRVKRATMHVKRRRSLRKKVKGFKWDRKNTIRLSKTAAIKSGVNAYRGRKEKKRDARALWNIKINAGVRPSNLSYSKFISALKKNNIQLNRKVLSELAEKHPAAFAELVKAIS